MSNNLLAELLGLSKYRVSQLKRQGMPTGLYSEAAAFLLTINRRRRFK